MRRFSPCGVVRRLIAGRLFQGVATMPAGKPAGSKTVSTQVSGVNGDGAPVFVIRSKYSACNDSSLAPYPNRAHLPDCRKGMILPPGRSMLHAKSAFAPVFAVPPVQDCRMASRLVD